MKATLKIKKKMAENFTFKDGKQAIKYSMLVESPKGSFYVSCFESKITKTWKEGDTVDMELTPWTGRDGKQNWNCKPYEVSINEVYALLQEIRGILVKDHTPDVVLKKAGFVKEQHEKNNYATVIETEEPPPHTDEDLRPDEEEGLPF